MVNILILIIKSLGAFERARLLTEYSYLNFIALTKSKVPESIRKLLKGFTPWNASQNRPNWRIKISRKNNKRRTVRAFLVFLHGAHYGNSHFGPHVLSAKNVSYIHTWELYMGDFFPCFPMCASFYICGRPFPFASIFIFGSRFLSNLTFWENFQ